MVFFKKEKEVIKLIENHADKVEECLSVSIKTISAYLEDAISEAKKLALQADHIETEADMVRHEIRDKLYLGAYMPLLREDIYKLVESLDVVANSAEKSCDFFLNQRPLVPDNLKADFLKTRYPWVLESRSNMPSFVISKGSAPSRYPAAMPRILA